MYKITVETAFTASHQLKLPDGSLENLHSHNWIVRASVKSEKLDDMGTVMDFNVLLNLINNVVKPFEDKNLKDFRCFDNTNYSAENLAEYIYKQLENSLSYKVKLDFVEITEQPGCLARYYKD